MGKEQTFHWVSSSQLLSTLTTGKALASGYVECIASGYASCIASGYLILILILILIIILLLLLLITIIPPNQTLNG